MTSVYASIVPTQTSLNQWPPSAARKVFNLAMIRTTEIRRGEVKDSFVKMTITGKVDDILREKYPVKISDIFSEGERESKRKVILFEGAPGCGKSTLAVFICQQWGEGKLYTEFQAVVLIRLRDPAIQNARCIADLLPSPDAKTAHEIAVRFCAKNCQGVLFILDGWDELPFNFSKDHILYQLVHPEQSKNNPFHESAVIVTSRPIASGDLHPIVSSRIEVLGFTPTELTEYFTECLRGETRTVKILLDRINENPAVLGSCYLPLNASILVHLFMCDNKLPATQYGIFSELILSCIFRHFNERTPYKNLRLTSLDDVPEVVKKPLFYLSKLAYEGVMDDKVVFLDLPANLNTLGLLHGVESFIRRGKAVSYNFIHLSIQEVLAAFFIATQLPQSEQVSKFNDLFEKSRFSSVFQYYAAFTKLQTPGIDSVLTKIATNSGVKQPTQKDKTLLLSLLHCLYEAQSPSVCESIISYLQCGLNLSEMSLTPLDGLCVGYFVSCVCLTEGKEFKIILNGCGIDDGICKYLIKGVKTCTSSCVTTGTLSLDLSNNNIHEQGVGHVAEIQCISTLSMNMNKHLMDQGAFHLAELLKQNTILSHLSLANCGLTFNGAKSIAFGLTTNSSLKVLNLSNNELFDSGIEYISHALKINHALKELSLECCGMTDDGFESIAVSLEKNTTLEFLSLSNATCVTCGTSHSYVIRNDKGNPYNTFTDEGISTVTEYLQNNDNLLILQLPRSFHLLAPVVQEIINVRRKKHNLSLIEITSEGLWDM